MSVPPCVAAGRPHRLRRLFSCPIAALGLAALLAGAPAAAPAPAGSPQARAAIMPRFALPLRCTPGDDCFVQNHVDRDPGPGRRDYACGPLTYDGHQGTDFRLPSLARMEEGVEVLAAAPGVVLAVRDGEPDQSVRERGAENVRGREAGNGVRIDHGGGWQTQYSHLKRGSVRVTKGQRVGAGEVLGLVGLSGNTEFPHVDFVVRFNGRPIDPFDGQPMPSSSAGAVASGSGGPPAACPAGPTDATVWQPAVAQQLRYVPTAVLIAGFASEAPERSRAQRGEYREPPQADAPMLVYYVEAFGLRRGDRERFEISGPDGRPVTSRELVVDRDLAARFAYVGRRSATGRWPAGAYAARYAVEREGRVVAEDRRELVIR